MTDEDEINAMLASVIPIDRPITNRRRSNSWVSGSETEIAARVLSELTALSTAPVVAHSAALWTCGDDALWTRHDYPSFSTRVQGYDGEPCGKHKKPMRIGSRMVAGAWELLHHRIGQEDFRQPVGIATTSGFLTVDGARVVLRQLENADMQSGLWAVTYTELSDAPWWDYCAQRWWPTEGWQERQRLIEAYAGLCYLGAATRYDRILLLKGRAGNGKSTLLHALTHFLPPSAVCSIAPDKWGTPTALLEMVGARFNWVGELSDHERIPGAELKLVVGGDPIVVKKLYKNELSVRMIAGHIVASNPWPGVTDRTEGGWDRWMVVMLPHKLRGTTDEIGKDELWGHLRAEGTVIFSRCIRAARDVLARGTWPEPQFSKDAKAMWRCHSDPVAAFVAARLEPRVSAGIGVQACFDVYRQWAQTTNTVPLSLPKFVERLEHLGIESVRGRQGSHFKADLSMSDSGKFGGVL